MRRLQQLVLGMATPEPCEPEPPPTATIEVVDYAYAIYGSHTGPTTTGDRTVVQRVVAGTVAALGSCGRKVGPPRRVDSEDRIKGPPPLRQ